VLKPTSTFRAALVVSLALALAAAEVVRFAAPQPLVVP